MENENQNPKLSLRDVLKIKDEICSSHTICDRCPFLKGHLCIAREGDMAYYADKIETICTEWEMNKLTLAEKVNEILKPYGMKLDRNYIFCFTDKNVNEDDVVNALYTTKWEEN